MSTFDHPNNDFEHRFVKKSPKLLQEFFGTTDVMPLWIADMEFQVAQPITDEIKRIANREVYAYEFSAEDLPNAFVAWFKSRHGLALEPGNFIQVPNVLTGIAVLLRELSQPGESVLIQTPVYHQFAKLIEGANRNIVRSPLKLVDGKYEMDFVDLEQQFSAQNISLMILCNPHNPVGRVWNGAEIQRLVALADKHNVRIISDEIHCDIVYSGHRFNSILSQPQNQHIALLGSPSKTFGMQSIANGYLHIRDKKTRAQINHTVETMYLNHGNALTAFATIAAYKHGGPWLDELIAYLETTIAWVQEFIDSELPEVTMHPVEGTYQIWLDFSGLGLSPDELMELMVKKAKIGLAPGSWFDENCPLCMRMNIATPLSKIQTVFEQLKLAVRASS